MILWKIFFIIIAYLIGSVPFGFLIGKMKGIDVRKEGSKNIGATNVGRLLGKKYAILTYFLDMLKGFVLVFLFNFQILPSDMCVISPIIYGVITNIGHAFPIYLKFKGGKSVSCASGSIAGYCPIMLPIVLIIFFIIKRVGKLVSLSSLLTAFIALIMVIILSICTKSFYFMDINTISVSVCYPYDLYFVLGTLLIVLILYIKHIPNIKRIINGEELPTHY